MGFWSSLAGTICVEITSASVEQALTELNVQGITLVNVKRIDDLVVSAQILRRDYRRARKLAKQRGYDIRVVKRQGLYWLLKGLLVRPVMIVGMCMLLFLSVYLPTRVLFVTVQGNASVASRLIVEKASECGIGFGSSRRSVRSERMKNALLQSLPQLQWAGVNTYGCVAVISVEERSVQDANEDVAGKVNSIVAARDGIIEELTVLRGNALCRVGQAVKQGQLLVSAYTDCGLSIKAESAQAEIKASTMRSQSAVTPCNAAQRGQVLREETHYSIQIGKNIIKLCKGSGISDPTCVKMYERIPLLLPGGFQLPVSMIGERVIYHEIQTLTESDPQKYSWLIDQAQAYLRSQMVAGQILHCLDNMRMQGDACYLDGIYACTELIGQVLYERNIQGNGQTN